MDTFAILNIIALGVFAGTFTGLAIGYLAKRQKYSWSSMTVQDKRANIALVLFFTPWYLSLSSSGMPQTRQLLRFHKK